MGVLAVHVAGGLSLVRGAPATGAGRTLLVCPGLPTEPGAAARTGRTFPQLADRLAATSGWRTIAACLRGVGPSDGDFSLAGWLDDLGTLVDLAAGASGTVWIAGFGVAGSMGVCLAARDERVRGVATLGSPASFAGWAERPADVVTAVRRLGVLRDAAYPPDPVAWSAVPGLQPAQAAAGMSPRSLLVVHGVEDDVVPVADARALAAAGRPDAELRLLAGAGHRLRPDPRAVALLLGWLERQGP